jgi:hypothetical protein
MTIVTLVSGCGNAYAGDGSRHGDGQGGRWVSSAELLEVPLRWAERQFREMGRGRRYRTR